ncbi:MAG: GNAT family N-acetyltransferase [Desulfurococcales archaeon]|nr:GNAT family N-acetyltransferase [Desulfurococcales archaeon]
MDSGPKITIRRLLAPEEFREAVEVQRQAWNMEDYREAAPAHLLRALADNGGLVIGAFLEGRLVGLSYGWPSRDYFYSHATGVAPSVKYRGIGFLLKTEQRRLVIESYGHSLIKWTFDPLQGLNSVFNLAKLGAIGARYMINYYGEIEDNINRGLGSDRVKAEWHITSPRVLYRLKRGGAPSAEILEELGAQRAISVAEQNGLPIPILDLNVTSDIAIIEIPLEIASVRDKSPEVARMWRDATRKAYSTLIGRRGYYLVDSIKLESKVLNVLWRRNIEDILSTVEPWRAQS